MKSISCKFFLLLMLLLFSGIANSQESVMIGVPKWSSGKVIAGLIKAVVEDRLDGKVGLVSDALNEVSYTSMHRGDGEIDIHPDIWLPNQQAFVTQYVEDKQTVRLSKYSYIGRTGFCISKRFSRERNIKSVFDLLDENIAQSANVDNSGRGDIWVGFRSWSANKINRAKMRGYGLDKFYRHYSHEEGKVLAQMAKPQNNSKNFIFYCYQPSSWFTDDFIMLSEPEYKRENHNMVWPKEHPSWYKLSNVKTADKAKAIHVGYSKSLEERAPKVAAFLKNIQLDTEMINKLVYQLPLKKETPVEIARKWISNNPERVNDWLVEVEVVENSKTSKLQ